MAQEMEKKQIELQHMNYGTKEDGSEIQKSSDVSSDIEQNSEETNSESDEKQGLCEKLIRPLCPCLPWSKMVKKKRNDRVQWDNRAQFILTLVGYAIGLGNVWRFSYLVAKNGGAVFIIPYVIMLFIVGIPLFYLETILGQIMRKGPIAVWYKLVPNLWGIGLASIVVTLFISIYYNVIISWVILYLLSSFQDPLPWGKCGNYTVSVNATVNENHLEAFAGTADYAKMTECFNDSTRFYWYNTALEASENIDMTGGFNWKVYLTLALAWVIIYFCIFKGIQWTGKVVYFTAVFPLLMLVVMFFRAVTLEGAVDGLAVLFIPEASEINLKLFSPQVWLEAASQIFFSLGLSLGAIIALSSYTKPRSNTLVDSLIVCFTNSFTSIFASVIVFSIIGFRAHINNIKLTADTVFSGPGLAFIVFSEAITLLPGGPFWSLLFFFMLLLLGLDSQFGSLEGFITALYDNKRIKKVRKEIVTGVVCILQFAVSFPFVLGNGIYLFQLFDQFNGTLPLLLIGLIEVITISWIYGVDKIFEKTERQMYPAVKIFWWIIWFFVSPAVMFVILLGSVIVEIIKPLAYTAYGFNEGEGSGNANIRMEYMKSYPSWALFIGAVLVLSSVLCIPGVLIVRLVVLQEARDQAMAFYAESINRLTTFLNSCKRIVPKSNSYSPQVDETESSDTPYIINGFATEPAPCDNK